jgi:hypothetical protein
VRHGIASIVPIGVRKDRAFIAHAWLEVGGEVVLGGPVSDYSALCDKDNYPRSEASLETNQR